MPVRRPLRSILPYCSSLILAACLALPAALQAQAQATTGVIRGIVSDSSGGTLAGATVRLRNLETNAERSLTTNERGVFVATLLRVGTYDVAARAVGFRESKQTGVTLRLGETLDLPFVLARQAVQLQEITVAAEEPLVDVTRVGERHPPRRGGGRGAPEQRPQLSSTSRR